MATSGGVLIKALISQLANDGEKSIREAYEGREFTNRTYNLHDSYGSAVYYNGTLVKSSIRYVGAEMAEEDDRCGRNEVNDFFCELESIFAAEDFTKAQIVESIKKFIPNFEHEEKGKNLDQKM